MESGVKFLHGFSLFFSFSLLVFDLALESSLESSPSLFKFLVVVEVSSESSSQVVELSLIFLSDFGQGNGGGVLLVDELSEGSFSFDEAVGDI